MIPCHQQEAGKYNPVFLGKGRRTSYRTVLMHCAAQVATALMARRHTPLNRSTIQNATWLHCILLYSGVSLQQHMRNQWEGKEIGDFPTVPWKKAVK